MQKKGAMELSVNTIVVVVIGITLLVLGLVLVRQIFGEAGSSVDEIFDDLDGVLEGIQEVNQLLTVSPGNLEVEQGNQEGAVVTVANLEREDTNLDVYMEITPSDEKVRCVFADTMQTKSNNYQIKSGQWESVKVLIEELNGPLRTAVCNVNIVGATSGDSSDQIIINVVPKQKLFG